MGISYFYRLYSLLGTYYMIALHLILSLASLKIALIEVL